MVWLLFMDEIPLLIGNDLGGPESEQLLHSHLPGGFSKTGGR